MIKSFEQKWPNAEWGPAHIVFSDYNLWDGHIHFCLKELADWLATGRYKTDDEIWNQPGGDPNFDHSLEEAHATDAFLLELLKIPEDERTRDIEW